MSVLAKSTIDNAQDGEFLSGVVLVKSYGKKMTKGSVPKPYIDGVLVSGTDLPFKIWQDGSGLLDKMLADDLQGKACQVSGKVQLWQGNKSIILTDCTPVSGYDIASFLPVKYNSKSYIDASKNFLMANLSPEGYDIISEILFNDDELWNRFTTEFCARSHHDNCRSGLLVHSYKVLLTMNFVLSVYPTLLKCNPRKMDVQKYQSDLYFIGAFIHDIGKTVEMKMGVYQPNTAVTHRYFGTEIVAKHKDKIIATYDEKWYYDLISIITQHHHEFGERAKTVFAYVTHLVDYQDTMLTGLCEAIEGNTNEDASGVYVFQDKDTILHL